MARISTIYGGTSAKDHKLQFNRDTGALLCDAITMGGVTRQIAPTVISAAGAITAAAHAGRPVVISAAAGIALTLPAATGSGVVYDFYIGVTITSSATTITSPASNFIGGVVLQAKTDGTTKTYNANGTSNRIITMDGSTKGGIVGDKISIIDIAANLYSIQVIQQASGTVVTPIS